MMHPAMPNGIYSAAPGGFNVLDLFPVLFLDSSDASTLAATGNSLTTWLDKSGNGYHASQTTGANKPQTGTRMHNGLNVIDFTAANSLFGIRFEYTMGNFDMTWILSGTQEEVEADITAIDQLAITWWRNAGYTVMEEGDTPVLISKINGADAPDLPRTTTWAKPALAPDGTWYAASPSIHSEWAVWKERLAATGYQLQTQEMAMPEEWLITENHQQEY